MDSLEKNLNHLLLARAFFTSMCLQQCYSPRLVQTMGMTLPFLLVLPRSVIHKERPFQHHVPDSTTSGLHDLDCTLELEDVRIDLDSHPPLVLQPQPRSWGYTDKLVLYQYIGPAMDLGDLLGAPNGLEPCRRLFTHQPAETCQTNSVRATLLRLLRNSGPHLDERSGRGMSSHDAGHLVIGDPSGLGIDDTSRRVKTDSMPKILLLDTYRTGDDW